MIPALMKGGVKGALGYAAGGIPGMLIASKIGKKPSESPAPQQSFGSTTAVRS